MAQKEDRTEWKVRPWAGTIDQLQRAGKRCEEKVAAASESGDAEDAPAVAVEVIEADGFSRKLTAIEDLGELGPGQVDQIDGIEISLARGYRNPSAAISASKERGLSVALIGPDRTWTAGLRHELEEILAPLGKMRPLPVGAGGYFWLGSLTFYLLLFGLGLYLKAQTDWPVGFRWSLALGIAALAVGLVVAVARLPTLELLSQGRKSTFERWRSRILGATVAIVLGIVASLLAALIDR